MLKPDEWHGISRIVQNNLKLKKKSVDARKAGSG
jgi:hypothetical protein